MHIPVSWAKAQGEYRTRDNRQQKVEVWGWGTDEASANVEAGARLERAILRRQQGGPLPDVYAYGDRPLREEILETIDDPNGHEPIALITRNRYGAIVLNAANLLFLDIDLPPASAGKTLKAFFSRAKPGPDTIALAALRDALTRYGQASFRIYQTAAGFRAIAVDRAFDPAGHDAQDLMGATGTDPAFANLCRIQKSFRARLTPKPWRCACLSPPSQFPRDAADVADFTEWLARYEAASSHYATCRFIEAVGPNAPSGIVEDLVGVHDAMTRCTEALPLA